jgi:predicted Zn-dependent protease
MITEKQCKKVIDLALEHARGKVDGIEVTVSASDVSTSRFANNEMTQNQSPYTVTTSVRVLTGGRQARVSAEDITPAGIRRLVDNTVTAASFLEKDPELLPLVKPRDVATVNPINRYDFKTAKISPAQRAKAVKEIIDVAKANKLDASGVYATGTNVHALGNSEGLFQFQQETEVECSITMTGANSSGWSKSNQTKATLVNPKRLAEVAAAKAIASANPQAVPAGHYTVILEPAAVLDLLGFLWYDFAGTSHTDKLSCFLGKVGKKMLGDNITITDDCAHALQSGAHFDGEGLPRQTVTLVDRGVIKNLVHGRKSSAAFNLPPTGHGVTEPSSMGEYPVNLVVAGGDTTVDEMIRTTEKGILLTRVWYVREVDPTTKIVTGMTRDGTFLVEGGKITAGTLNFRFNVSLIDMLNKVLALGPSERTAGEETFPAVVPAMKVADFNFASTTKF